MIVSGEVKPSEDFLLVELVASDGSVVGYRQVYVTPAADGSYVPYAVEVPYRWKWPPGCACASARAAPASPEWSTSPASRSSSARNFSCRGVTCCACSLHPPPIKERLMRRSLARVFSERGCRCGQCVISFGCALTHPSYLPLFFAKKIGGLREAILSAHSLHLGLKPTPMENTKPTKSRGSSLLPPSRSSQSW